MSAPTLESTITGFFVKIDGSDLAREQAEMFESLEEIIIDENLHMPAMLSMRIHLNNHDWLNSTVLAEGKKIEASASRHGTPVALFAGQIAAVEVDMDEQNPVITVRAYDPSFRLHRVHARRSFLNMTDSDIARKLAQEAGLTVGTIDATTTVHEYIYQNNESNYDFLRERALLLGYDFFCEDDKLNFMRPFQTTGAATTLEYGYGLRRFRVRTSLFEPASEVTVRGWDVKQKQDIVGRASTKRGLPPLASRGDGAQTAQSSYGYDAKYVVTNRVVESQGEADVVAQAYLDELTGSYIEAEGVCFGEPNIRLRRQVEIKGVGARFSAMYTVTAVRHTYDLRNGYVTWFTVSSRRDNSMRELLDPRRAPAQWPGPVIGIVTNINDPEGMDRIKVKFPTFGLNPTGTDNESHWARVATPMAGNGRGFQFLPEINDEVVVVFEQGDPRRPLVVGYLWNGKDKPPRPTPVPRGRDDQILKGGSEVKQRLIRSTKNHQIILNDSDDKPGIILLGMSGAFIMIDDETGDERITLLDKNGKNRIEIQSQQQQIHILCEGKMFITAKDDINVETQANLNGKVQGNAKVDVTGNADVTTQGNITLKATGNIDIQATGNLTMQGMQVSVSAQATAEVKGAMVNVTGTGPTAIKGTPVAIN